MRAERVVSPEGTASDHVECRNRNRFHVVALAVHLRRHSVVPLGLRPRLLWAVPPGLVDLFVHPGLAQRLIAGVEDRLQAIDASGQHHADRAVGLAKLLGDLLRGEPFNIPQPQCFLLVGRQ